MCDVQVLRLEGERGARVGRVGELDDEFVALPVVARGEGRDVDLAAFGVLGLELQRDGDADVLGLLDVEGGRVGALLDVGVDGW